ncbi:MAG: hypothetical protein DDT27_01331 [Dehalococcoidia bacterium]|nr:hypothetical protein [Chloroflexota bacterium]
MIYAKTLENLRRLASPFPDHSYEKMLGADELIFQPISLGFGVLEQLRDARGGINLSALIGHLRALIENLLHPLAYL